MELLILLTVVASAIAAGTVIRERSKSKRPPASAVAPTQKRIERINVLLQNIEMYDGTAKGQKRLEVISHEQS